MSLTRRRVAAFFGAAVAAMNVHGESEPQFAGFVTVLERGAGKSGARVTVESHANKIVRRHVVTVTPQTVIVKREGGAETTVNLDSLAVKSWVKVWFVGGAKSSYPVEVTARRIMIVDRL